MGRGDDGAEVLAGLVDSPPHLVVLLPDLHGLLVFVPAADFPDVIVGRQLALNMRGVGLVPRAHAALADEDESEPAVRHGVHLIVEVGIVRSDAEAGHAGLQELGVASVAIPATLPPAVGVVVADRGEVREVGSKNAVDRPEEPTRVLGIVEVALVQDQIGSFGLDELEDPSEIGAVSAVADEGDPQARVRGNRAGRSLCVPVRGSQGEGQEGRQNSADDETVSTHSGAFTSSFFFYLAATAAWTHAFPSRTIPSLPTSIRPNAANEPDYPFFTSIRPNAANEPDVTLPCPDALLRSSHPPSFLSTDP